MAVFVPQPETDDLLKKYFQEGKTLKVILSYLRYRHGILVSLSWLKRRLSMFHLRRKHIESPVGIFRALLAVLTELKTSNVNAGYRLMWQIVKVKYGVRVKRETIRVLLKALDPGGVAIRRQRRLKRRVYLNKGPNYVWHLDGHDKLSPYGLTIHGCVDGFSRFILWLEVSLTNHDPRVIATYYMRQVGELVGCPTIVRSDRGTENCHLATAHMALRHGHADASAGRNSYRYGKSTTNTRIEGLWCLLRKQKVSWWMELFQDLVAAGSLNPHLLEHRLCVTYTCAHVLQQDLDEFRRNWNQHRIRNNRMANCPAGVPADLYHVPEHFGTTNFIKRPVDMQIYREATQQLCRSKPDLPPSFIRMADAVLQEELHIRRDGIVMTNVKRVLLTLLNFVSTN